MNTQPMINSQIDQLKTNVEVVLETVLDHKKFLAEPVACVEFPEMSRDMTLANIDTYQENVILVHESQLDICETLNLPKCSSLFKRKIAAIVNLSRGLDGFAHKQQNTNITKLEESSNSDSKSIKDLWRGGKK